MGFRFILGIELRVLGWWRLYVSEVVLSVSCVVGYLFVEMYGWDFLILLVLLLISMYERYLTCVISWDEKVFSPHVGLSQSSHAISQGKEHIPTLIVSMKKGPYFWSSDSHVDLQNRIQAR